MLAFCESNGQQRAGHEQRSIPQDVQYTSFADEHIRGDKHGGRAESHGMREVEQQEAKRSHYPSCFARLVEVTHPQAEREEADTDAEIEIQKSFEEERIITE